MKKRFKKLLIGLSLIAMGWSSVSATSNHFTDVRKLLSGGTGLNGWTSDFNNGAAGTVTTGSMIVIDVTAAGTADWHAKFCKYATSVTGGNQYTLTFVMYATSAIKANYIVNNAAAVWSPYAGTWDMPISTSRASYTLNYTPSASSANVELLFQFGGNWSENRAGPFTIYIEKIILETKTPTIAFSDDLTAGTSGWTNAFSDGAAGSITNPSSNLVQNITSYGANNVWNVHLYKNTGIALTSGGLYRLEMDISVTASQYFEACFEDSAMSWEKRAGFNNGTWNTSTTHYSYTFTASTDIPSLFLHFQLGQAGSSNTLTIDNVQIYAYPSTFDETRVGYYASEFATVLGNYDTCVANAETGFLAAPTLKTNYFDKLIDASNLSSVYVTDYAYNAGEGTDPKTLNAVRADIKFAAMVAMYNANNGSNPDISYAYRGDVTKSNDYALPLIALLSTGIACGCFFFFKSKRKQPQ